MKHLLFFTSLFFSTLVFSQQDVVSTGGDASSSGGSVSYSIGQVAYESASGSNGSINQGVQQPFEIFVLAIPGHDESFTAMLFPNPTATSVILSLDMTKEGTGLVYELTDITGKIIRSQRIISDETSINVEQYAEACYFLNVLDGNKRVKTFKLLKKD